MGVYSGPVWQFSHASGRCTPTSGKPVTAAWSKEPPAHVVGWWQDYDLLLTPTMAQPPPPLGAIGDGSTDDDPMEPMRRAIAYGVFTAGFNSTGQPAISLPLGQSDEGLPIGVQLVGDLGREDLLIRVASQLEQSYPWVERRPPLFAAA